jgi:hypothetical protein
MYKGYFDRINPPINPPIALNRALLRLSETKPIKEAYCSISKNGAKKGRMKDINRKAKAKISPIIRPFSIPEIKPAINPLIGLIAIYPATKPAIKLPITGSALSRREFRTKPTRMLMRSLPPINVKFTQQFLYKAL